HSPAYANGPLPLPTAARRLPRDVSHHRRIHQFDVRVDHHQPAVPLPEPARPPHPPAAAEATDVRQRHSSPALCFPTPEASPGSAALPSAGSTRHSRKGKKRKGKKGRS